MLVTIYSLFVVIHLTSSLNVDIPLQTYELTRGGNGTIPCNFKPQKASNPSIIISWTAHPDNPDDSDIAILTYYYLANAENQLDIDAAYTDRASLQVDIAKGWANLTLKALTSKDSRVFQCEVKIPGDSIGKQSDTTVIVVLVPPSKPICAIQGTAEFYHNINLTCRSEEGTPKPTYGWQSYDGSNNPRPNPPKSTDLNGVLSLYNISAETSGYYICTSTNKIRSESCNLTLSVMPYSMKIGATAGIIGGCAVGLLLLIIVICCCVRRRKNKSEEYAMRSPEYANYTDKEPQEFEEHQETRVESKADRNDERSDRYDERSDRYDDRQDRDDRQGRPDNRQYDSDRYDDRRSDRYDDRQSDRYDDRRSDRYDDRRSDRYDDRRSDRYDDRRSDRYDDRRSDRYDDRRSDRYDEPRDRYDDRNSDRYADRYDDRRDRYDHPDDRYDGRSRPPNVPANKPTRG
ncbi:glycoprotein A33 (transmembrane), paralog a [Pangasianodon hypophthalmus]|uniref:glycoprotein A33 (transmembrane), paralog a n=1 Tax=Pangasianodon hypophthalmus TaxID=310915 RepID=UPI0023070CC4|nr:glycoprotein A33 (transmembrane), paralog a [Pangasianodon hypophthalmus]